MERSEKVGRSIQDKERGRKWLKQKRRKPNKGIKNKKKTRLKYLGEFLSRNTRKFVEIIKDSACIFEPSVSTFVFLTPWQIVVGAGWLYLSANASVLLLLR